jgi:hypothetical protein
MLGAGNLDPNVLQRGAGSIEHRIVGAIDGAGEVTGIEEDLRRAIAVRARIIRASTITGEFPHEARRD